MAKIAFYLCCLALAVAGCGVDDPPDVIPPSPEPVEQRPAVVPERYRMAFEYRPLIREYLLNAWGHDDYLSLAGAQVQQESAWNCAARSKFADGCAQFVDSTWKWARKTFCRWVPNGGPHDPESSLPCMVLYDHWLWKRVDGARPCHRNALFLASYNSGLGNVNNAVKQCQQNARCNDRVWFGHVEHQRTTADWAHKESRGYVQRILGILEDRYLNIGYGGKTSCGDVL